MHRIPNTGWLLGSAVALAVTMLVGGAYTMSVIEFVAMASLTAASFRFVMLIGEVSFATSAFVGIGAYGAGIATTLLGWPFLLAMLLGPLVVIVVSIGFGSVTLRIKGPYFMLIGFAFAEAVRIMFSKIVLIGGTSGMVGIFPPRYMDPWMPTVVMAVVLVAIFVLYRIEVSDFGKVLVAIRDNESIVRTVGVNVLFCKVACFVIASICAAIVGSLMAFVNNVISPGDFSYLLSAFALAYVKVGGEASIIGAISGAILLSLLGSYALGLGAAEQIFYGGAIIVAVLLMPKGLAGLLDDIRRKRTRVSLTSAAVDARTATANLTSKRT